LVKVKVVKNKLAPPFRIAEFEIIYGQGINKIGEIVDLGSQFDIIQKSGAWYSYNGAKIAQGRDSAKQFLMDNPEMAHELEMKIKEKLAAGNPAKQAAAVATDDDGDDF
jgi:recombination protein RecA